MRHPLHFILIYILICFGSEIQAQTTVSNGNWSSPTTWGGVPPLGTGTVVINHTVTLDMDYSHSAGSVTIGATGILNGNSVSRVFALNYPSGTAVLTVNGTINVARLALISGVATNNGVFDADSLLNGATLTNNSAGTITAGQFMINTGGALSNNGSIAAVNFFNIETVNNNGTLTSNDFANSKSFTNASTGIITLTHNFSNLDTIATPAVFTNNGSVSVQNNWYNGKQISGTGKFCISQSTWNAGTMSGSFDFCDQSGGAIDLNTGTIAPTITYCLFSCTTDIDEKADNTTASISPNPVHSTAMVVTNFELTGSILVVYNLYGQEVHKVSGLYGKQFEINRQQLNSGVYFFTIIGGEQTVRGKFWVD